MSKIQGFHYYKGNHNQNNNQILKIHNEMENYFKGVQKTNSFLLLEISASENPETYMAVPLPIVKTNN